MAARGLTVVLGSLVGVAAFAVAAALLDPGVWVASTRRPFPPEDDAAIRAALVSYQRVYQDFFASGGNPALIDEFPASRDVKHHVFRDLGYVREAGLVLVQDLATATVVELKRTGGDSAEAVVLEEWNYVFQNAADRTPASKLKGMGEGFRYSLRREDGRWRVVSWDLADVSAPPPREERTW